MEATKVLIFNNYTIMKKLFITLFLAVMAIGANAQVTWNVRAGVALANGEFDVYGKAFGSDMGVGPVLAIGSNIPLNNSKFTFSPSIISVIKCSVNGGLDFTTINIPLNIGYKIMLGNKSYFVPKIGPYIGYMHSSDWYGSSDSYIIGPSAELALEINHIIVALSGSMASESGQGCLTVGYKF